MLQILRDKAQSTFIQIIVVIIALVFVFWGVGANLSGDRQAAIVVNDEEISFQDFQKAYDRAYQQLSDQFGGNVPKGLAETFGIKQQVINQLIQTALLRQGATEMGIFVSSEEVRQTIETMVQFQDNGGFSLEKYKSVLAANRLAPSKFEQSMRTDRLSQIGSREVSNFASVATNFEIQEIYSQMNEKIGLKYVKVSPASYTESVEINEQGLADWFETEKENYKTDPELKLRYLAFTNESVASKIEIDDAKIEQYYQDNPEEFVVAEQRHARHILFKAGEDASIETLQKQSEQAESILQLAKGGADFAELAKQYSEGPSKASGGDLGFFSKGRMVPAFEDAVFALSEGDISEVIKTRFGYHIILLEEIKPETTRPLDVAKNEIKKNLQAKEAESLTFQLANSAYEGIISAGSLAQYEAANPEAEIKDTELVTKNSCPADIKNDAEFLAKSFELNKGELSSLIKGQTGYAIFYAEDSKAPQIPEFDAIKEKLQQDYRKAESNKLAESAAKDLLATITDGTPFDEAVENLGLSPLESGLIGRNSQNADTEFPTSLIENSFLLSLSSPLAKEVGTVGSDYYVYTLMDRQVPSMPEDSEEAATYRTNLLNFKQQQLLSAWLRNLESSAKITQHQSL